MLKIFKNENDVLRELAAFVAESAVNSIADQGSFTIALSGGSSPKKLFELLASAYREKVAWQKVFFFFGDERYVPLDDERSNYLMAHKALFSQLQIPEENIFAVNTSLTPAEAARDYEFRIVNHFNSSTCKFDLILLGLGDNSHTASLFPFTSVLHEKQSLVKEVFVDEVDMYRITFTAPLINAAHIVAFLVYGSSKADAVHHILKDVSNIEAYPAQLISPVDGTLYWFLDETAAQKVT